MTNYFVKIKLFSVSRTLPLFSHHHTLIHKWQISYLLNVNQIQSEIYSKPKLYPTTDLSYRNEFLTHSSKVKIQHFTPGRTISQQHVNIMATSIDVIVAVIIVVIHLPHESTEHRQQYSTLNIYYNFCFPCDMRSLIYLAYDWIFGCSTTDANSCHTIRAPFRNRIIYFFFFSFVASSPPTTTAISSLLRWHSLVSLYFSPFSPLTAINATTSIKRCTNIWRRDALPFVMVCSPYIYLYIYTCSANESTSTRKMATHQTRTTKNKIAR